MADTVKTLKINLVTDVRGLFSIEKGLTAIAEVEKAINTVKKEQEAISTKLYNTHFKLSEIIEKGGRGANLMGKNIEIAMVAANSKISLTIDKLKTLQEALLVAKTLGGYNVPTTSSVATPNLQSSNFRTVAESRALLQEKLLAETRLVESILTATNAKQLAQEENHLRHRNSLQETAAARRLQTTRDQISQQSSIEEAGRARELASLRRDIELRSAINARATSLIAGMSSVNRNFTGASTGDRLTAGMTSAAITSNSTALATNRTAAIENAHAHTNLGLRILEIMGIYKAYNLILNTTWGAMKAIPNIGIQFEATKAILTSTMGSVAGASSAIAAIDKEAERAGISVATLRESFRLFHASTSLAGESLEDTWRMFTNLNTVVTSLHLSAAQATGVFNALSQIFNKSKVQSEELVKQLGNLLPGAFASFATATGRSTMQLSQDMKKGLVFAHEEVLKFTEFLSDRFGKAFEIASQGMNASLERLKTGFTHLGEAIYASNSGPMVAAVKSLTKLTEYLALSVRETTALSIAFSTAFNIAVGIAVGLAVKLAISLYSTATAAALASSGLYTMSFGAVAASTAAVGLSAAMSFLFSPVVIIAGIVAIGLALFNLGKDAKEAANRIKETYDTLNKEKLKAAGALSLEIRVEDDPGVKRATEDAATAEQSLAAFNKTNEATSAFWQARRKLEKEELTLSVSQAKSNLTTIKANALLVEEGKDIAARAALDNDNERSKAKIAVSKLNATNEESARISFREIHEEDVAKSEQIRSKAISNLLNPNPNERIRAEEQLAEQKQYKENLLQMEDSYAGKIQDKVDKAGASAASKAETEANKGIALLQRQLDSEVNINENKLKILDRQNKSNLISFKDYYDARQAIIQKNFEVERRSGQDPFKLAEVESKYSTELELNELARAANDEKFLANAEELRGKLQDRLGIAREETTEFTTQQRLLVKRLELEIASGNVVAEQFLATVRQTSALEALQKVTTALRKEETIANDKYNEGINRTNILFQTGSISQLEAAIQLDKQAKQAIATRQEGINKQEEALKNFKVTPELGSINAYTILAEDIRKAKVELESFTLTSNHLKDFTSNLLVPSLSGAFVGFVSGAMTGKEAMISFAQGVMKAIADIAAQELAKQIIGGLFGVFAGAFAGAGGNSSSFSAATGSTSSLSSNFVWASAKGNVYPAGSISKYSGTIVDKPTFFAKGGNVMGEAGPEAILPLTRNSRGQLGVSLSGSSNSGSVVIQNLSVTIQEKEGESSQEQAVTIGKAIKEQLALIIDKKISDSTRSGGLLNPTQMVANF